MPSQSAKTVRGYCFLKGLFFQQKITWHTKKQGNMAYSKKQSPKTNLKKQRPSVLLDNKFKTTVLNVLNELKEDTTMQNQKNDL